MVCYLCWGLVVRYLCWGLSGEFFVVARFGLCGSGSVGDVVLPVHCCRGCDHSCGAGWPG